MSVTDLGTGLKEALRQRALNLGADFFGVADLSGGRELVREQGGEMLAQFDRALSVGVSMSAQYRPLATAILGPTSLVRLVTMRSNVMNIFTATTTSSAQRLPSVECVSIRACMGKDNKRAGKQNTAAGIV